MRPMADHATLLERAAERERLVAATRRAAAGEPAVVILEGAAGLGKTALLQDARAGIGTAVLAARPAEHESAFAYGVLRQLLGGAVDRLGPSSPGPVAAGVAALSDVAGPGVPVDASFGVVDGLYWLVAELAAAEPLTLVVDDLHWADAPSLRFLGHLLRRLDGLPLAVVLALRPDEPGSPADLLDPLRLDPRADVVRLQPLTPAAVERLLGPASPELVAACHRASAGNPLYLRELLRELDGAAAPDPGRVADASPATIARHVARRVARLGPEALALAEAMAVLGDGAALATAGVVADVEPALARRHADELRRMGVLAAADPVRFEHPVVRSAVRSALAPGRRDALPLRAATVLAAARAPAEQVAAQLLAVAPGAGAPLEPLRAAAALASARGAPDVAAAYLRRAVAEPPPAAEHAVVLHDLAQQEEMLGEPDWALHLRQALDAAPDGRRRVDWTVELAMGTGLRGRVTEALTILEDALDADWLTARADRDLLGAFHCALAWAGADGSPRAAALLARYEREPPADPIVARLVAGARSARMALPHAEVVAVAEEALDGDGLERGVLLGSLMALGSLVYADQLAVARERLERALELARGSGNLRAIGAVHTMLAVQAHAAGDLDRCELHARTQLGPLRVDLTADMTAFTTAVLLHALIDRGDLAGAEAVVADVPPDHEWARTCQPQFFLRAARGRLRCAQGRLEEGVADLAAARRCLARFSQTVWSPVGFDGLSEEPLALHRLGRAHEARDLLDAALPSARAVSPPRIRAATLRVAATLAGGEAGIALAEEAVAAVEGTGARLAQAAALTDLGVLLRRGGRRTDAREPLGRALDLALECGAGPLADRARDELAATGARPRRDRLLGGRDALTPSEARLARMAADGRTNREIAQVLYLSQKTVEMHLGRAYRKLGITGRAELASALLPEGDAPPAAE